MKRMKLILFCLFILLSNGSSYGMEEKSLPLPDYSSNETLITKLKEGAQKFEKNIDSLITWAPDREKNKSKILYKDILLQGNNIALGLKTLKSHVETEINQREDLNIASPAHHEISALFCCLTDGLSKSNLNKKLKPLEKDIDLEEKEKRQAALYSQLLKSREVIELFFKMVDGNKTAYRLCEKSHRLSQLFEVFKNPKKLYEIGDRCYKRWNGENGKINFGQAFEGRIDKELEELEKILKVYYSNADIKYQECLRSEKEINNLRKEEYTDDPEYREEGWQDEINGKIHESDLSKQEAEKALNEAFNNSDECYLLKEKEVNKLMEERSLAKTKGNLNKVSGNSNFIFYNSNKKIPRTPEKLSGQLASIIGGIPRLIKDVMYYCRLYQALDDMKGEFIAASCNPDFILSDLASRLRQDDAAENKKDKEERKYIRFDATRKKIEHLTDMMHDGMVVGRRVSYHLPKIPADLAEVQDTFSKLAGLILNVGKKMDTRGCGFFKSYFISENAYKDAYDASFKLESIYQDLSNKIVPTLSSFIDALRKDMSEQQDAIIKLDALTRLIKKYAVQDSRTRNIGDTDCLFRKWFDQLGSIWCNPVPAKSEGFEQFSKDKEKEKDNED